jgi:hypothetical protein
LVPWKSLSLKRTTLVDRSGGTLPQFYDLWMKVMFHRFGAEFHAIRQVVKIVHRNEKLLGW